MHRTPPRHYLLQVTCALPIHRTSLLLTMNQLLRRPWAVLVALIALALTLSLPVVSEAGMLPHLRLKASFPAKDTTLATPPEAVKLWLSEPADLATSRIAVTDAKGAAVPTAKPTRGSRRDDPLVATFVKAPGDGSYTVTWKAMSTDGHVVDGSYRFTVKLSR